MIRYFRTLFYLIRFFLEDDFLYIGYPKNDEFYPVVMVTRQILKKHLLEPFKATHTLSINQEYALQFKKRLLMSYSKHCNAQKYLPSELNTWLWKYRLTFKDISYNNGRISSFSYSYL